MAEVIAVVAYKALEDELLLGVLAHRQRARGLRIPEWEHRLLHLSSLMSFSIALVRLRLCYLI